MRYSYIYIYIYIIEIIVFLGVDVGHLVWVVTVKAWAACGCNASLCAYYDPIQDASQSLCLKWINGRLLKAGFVNQKGVGQLLHLEANTHLSMISWMHLLCLGVGKFKFGHRNWFVISSEKKTEKEENEGKG